MTTGETDARSGRRQLDARMSVGAVSVAVALAGCGGSQASEDGGRNAADGSANGDVAASMGNQDSTLVGDDARGPGDG